MEKMFLKPADKLQVRDPETLQPLPADGGFVSRTPYWLRRLRDGDVVEAKAPKTQGDK